MSRRGDRLADHGNQSAPWRDQRADGSLGPEFLPLSPRTGRAVAQSTAQREYRDSFDSVPVLEEGQVGGLWDYEREPRKPHAPKPTEERYDTAEMRALVEKHGHELTGHQWEVYTRFWVERRSYAYMARLFSCSVSNVRGTIAVLRKEKDTRVLARQQTTGQVRCPKCQARTEVTKVRQRDQVTVRDRLCPGCRHGFRTEERLAESGD